MLQKWSNTEILLEAKENFDYPLTRGQTLSNTLAIKAAYTCEIHILLQVSFFLDTLKKIGKDYIIRDNLREGKN